MRETRMNWTNDDVDYRQGSILEHRFQSHMWSLHLQVKQVEYGVGKLEDTLRREESIINGENDKWNTNQVSQIVIMIKPIKLILITFRIVLFQITSTTT